MKRTLPVAQAVEAAVILFELNAKPEGVFALAQKAGFPCTTKEEKERLLLEWRAWVHSAVLYGLMVQAPNIVVVEYLRVTQDLLKKLGYTEEQGRIFVDGAFKDYTTPLVQTQTKECPAVFFRRLVGKELVDVSPQSAALVSSVMAMILSAILDKLEQYEFAVD